MAIRFNANTEFLSRNTGGHSSTTFTVAGHFRLDTDINVYSVAYSIEASGEHLLIATTGDGVTINSYLGADNSWGITYTAGVWRYLAFTYSAGTTVQRYADGTAVTGDPLTRNFGSGAASVMRVGKDSSPSQRFEGCVERLRIWNAVLSDAELDAEMASATVVRTANLYGDYPLTADADDISGNANHWTVNGTPDYVAGPFGGGGVSSKPNYYARLNGLL
jgi:hypothetical protein